MKKLGRVFDRLMGIGIFLAASLLIFVTLSVNVEIFSRYTMGQSLIWVTEISEISLLFITFLGVAWVQKKEKHVNVDIVLNRLAPKVRNMLNFCTSIVGAIAVLPLVWWGIQVTWIHYKKGLYEATALEIPDVLVLFIIPLGSILLFIQLLIRARGFLMKRNDPKTEEDPITIQNT